MRVIVCFLLAALLAADQQHEHEHGHAEVGDAHGMHEGINPANKFLMMESSGTYFQPASWPMPMLMTRLRNWRLMWMGQAFLVETIQGGARGHDKLYSPNWGMLGAVHDAGSGSVMLRAMVSLDPITVTHRSYPLLFQTGETAFGKPLVDAQHPHDLLMELSIQYARSIGEQGKWYLYYAPVGEPALGPVAYPHRASAIEIPQAALAHHWQDSTHIANNVVTAGIGYGKVRLEASGFHGREPNENRWNIDMGAVDSWAGRFSVAPSRNWMAQVSTGRLAHPEEAHPGDVWRTTASVQYNLPRSGGTYWATSVVFGQNHKLLDKTNSNAVLAETLIPIRRKNFITARVEWSQRDELFANDHNLEHTMEERTGKSALNVAAYTVGYARDFRLLRNAQTGIGSNVSVYSIAPELKPYYGRHPWGVNVYFRVRLRSETLH